MSPRALLIEIQAFVSFGPQMRKRTASINIYEVVRGSGGRKSTSMRSSPDRKHLETHASHSWQTTPVGELILYSTSLCSSYKLIFTHLQAVEKMDSASLCLKSYKHSWYCHHPSRLLTQFHNFLHAKDLHLQLTLAWQHPKSLTPKYPQVQISKLRNPCFLSLPLSQSAMSLSLGNLATSCDWSQEAHMAICSARCT